MKKRRYRICLTSKNDDTESFLRLIPDKNDDTDEKIDGYNLARKKRRYTDSFLRFLTEVFSTRVETTRIYIVLTVISYIKIQSFYSYSPIFMKKIGTLDSEIFDAHGIFYSPRIINMEKYGKLLKWIVSDIFSAYFMCYDLF